MKKIIVILFACFSGMQMSAQITGTKDFIRLPYAYKFCSENADISIPIPSGWGFQVPFLNEKDASLLLKSDKVRYSVDTDSVGKAYSILFASVDEKSPCLELRMHAFGSAQSNGSEISSDFGNFYPTDRDAESVESYQNITDYNILTFRILTKDEKVKQTCRDIIASCKKCYDYDNSTDYPEEYSINYYAKDSTYYPELGLTFITPIDMSAVIRATKIEINKATTLLTAFVSLDEISELSRAATFKTSGFNMKYMFQKKTDAEDVYEPDLDEYKNSCIRKSDYSINGIPTKIYVYGSSTMPSIDVVIPVKTYSAVFTFSNVTAGNVEKVSDFISQISFDDVQKEGIALTGDYPVSFSDLVNIQNFGFRQKLPEVSLNKKSSKNLEVLECTFPEINAKISVPYMENHETYPSGSNEISGKNGKYQVTLEKETDSNDPEMNIYAGVIGTSSDIENYCILMLPANEEKLTPEQYLNKQYALFECGNDDNVNRLGYCDINGKRWYVMTVKTVEYSEFEVNYFVTEHNGNLIEIKIIKSEANSPEAKTLTKDVESLLYKASFK